MKDTPKWVIVVVATLLVIGLLAFARGRVHHRGDEVGALARTQGPSMFVGHQEER